MPGKHKAFWHNISFCPYQLALGLECFVEVEGRPPIVIHSSLRLIRHTIRILQHSRGLGMAASHNMLGWERLAIR